MNNLRVGTGFDVHAFAEKRKLILGGVNIEYKYGLIGHSDADVLVHAVIDSLLGAAGLPDIGILFPDNDEKYRGISSLVLLRNVSEMLIKKNIEIVNIDSVLICEKPKIREYISEMKSNISRSLNGLPADRIGIKGKTTEKLGFTGRGEGIAAQAVSLVIVL